jgi:hypothetical protein
MLFAFSGRATTNFLVLVVVMHFILFIDRVNLAAAASVMQQDLSRMRKESAYWSRYWVISHVA